MTQKHDRKSLKWRSQEALTQASNISPIAAFLHLRRENVGSMMEINSAWRLLYRGILAERNHLNHGERNRRKL